METLTRSASVRDRVKVWRDSGQRIALVPTMGTLHKGHMSLVAEAQERADHVIVSVFADPSQRDVHTLEADRELLANVGADLLFVPPVQEIFPIGRELSAVVNLPMLADVLDGASRPGYFAATVTVLTKLFNIVTPDIALFGERDFQQLVMVRRLVDDLFLSIEIKACPTLRDSDGLALATVNRNLTPPERSVAPLLYAALANTADEIDSGARDYDLLQRRGAESLSSAGFVTEYFVIRQAVDLAPIRPGARDLVIMAAARLGQSRLADSLPFGLIDHYE
jgi:pantoate--beta-alanine ligase